MYAYQDPAIIDWIARIIVNARAAGAANPDSSNHEPDVARTPQGTTPRPEVERAA